MAKKNPWNNVWAGTEGHTGGGGGGQGHGGRGQGGGGGNGNQQQGGWGWNWQSHYPGGGGAGGGGGGGNGGGGGAGAGGRHGGNGRGGRNLRDSGLSAELKQNLKNIEEAMKQADEVLLTGYNERVGDLAKTNVDNEKAAAGSSFENIGNRGRERMNAMSELMAQGAGESDVLRGQGMSLRNWSQNQNDVSRAFNETLTSINSSLGDLTTDTRSARVGNFQQAQTDKQQQWNNYFDAKSEAWTNLGNVYGQQAQYYADANEQVGSKKSQRRMERAQRKSDKAFMKAARVGSQSRDAAEVPDTLMDWKGADDFKNTLTNNNINSLGAGPAMVRPEGATLRKWNA